MELSSKKTITLFCPATLPLKTGAGINAFNLAKEFLKLDYKVRVVSFRRENHSVFDNIEGIDIVRIPYNDNKIINEPIQDHSCHCFCVKNLNIKII